MQRVPRLAAALFMTSGCVLGRPEALRGPELSPADVRAHGGGPRRSDVQRSAVLCVVDSSHPGDLRPLRVQKPQADTTLPDLAIGYAAPGSGLEGPWAKVLGAEYQLAGAPRHVRAGALIRIGERQGATIFIEDGLDLTTQPEIIYVLAPTCEFVPYRSRYWSRQ